MKASEMNQGQLTAAAQDMCKSGSGFVSRLGDTYCYADTSNRARLVAAFPELFEQYAEKRAKGV